MKKFLCSFIVFYILSSPLLYSQVGINKDGSPPDPSAGLEVKFTDKGFLMPRLTTSQIFYIENPAAGLICFNTDSLDFWYFDGLKWNGMMDHSDNLDPA